MFYRQVEGCCVLEASGRLLCSTNWWKVAVFYRPVKGCCVLQAGGRLLFSTGWS